MRRNDNRKRLVPHQESSSHLPTPQAQLRKTWPRNTPERKSQQCDEYSFFFFFFFALKTATTYCWRIFLFLSVRQKRKHSSKRKRITKDWGPPNARGRGVEVAILVSRWCIYPCCSVIFFLLFFWGGPPPPTPLAGVFFTKGGGGGWGGCAPTDRHPPRGGRHDILVFCVFFFLSLIVSMCDVSLRESFVGDNFFVETTQHTQH